MAPSSRCRNISTCPAGWAEGKFFAARRLVANRELHHTKSKLKVGSGDLIFVYPASVGSRRPTPIFRDGAPLTGQSDHIVNWQVGLEDTDHLSQQTFDLLLCEQARDRSAA